MYIIILISESGYVKYSFIVKHRTLNVPLQLKYTIGELGFLGMLRYLCQTQVYSM